MLYCIVIGVFETFQVQALTCGLWLRSFVYLSHRAFFLSKQKYIQFKIQGRGEELAFFG
jgi:hypothetical protein